MILGTADKIVIYPVLEVQLEYIKDGDTKQWTIPSCCFHDLWSAPDDELAGMGLAIVGNLTKTLGSDLYDKALFAYLLLKRHPKDKGIECPWPGMPDDRPVMLDLTQMPFETAMFLDDNQLKYRVDRMQLMARIQHVWVPWLKQQMDLANA